MILILASIGGMAVFVIAVIILFCLAVWLQDQYHRISDVQSFKYENERLQRLVDAKERRIKELQDKCVDSQIDPWH